MGTESRMPIITEKSYRYNFTNEGGVDRTFRVLKNIMGLWLLQQCKKSWKDRRDYSYAELVDAASEAPPFKSFVDPDDSSFFNPDDMPFAIAGYYRKYGQNVPIHDGEFVQIILQSLALKCRYVLEQIQEISAKRIEKIVITGGGIQNRLLNQYIADATGLPVTTAIPEGTAAGNIMVQAMALGEVHSLAEIRQVIRRSIKTQTYPPRQTDGWNGAYSRFLNFRGKSYENH
jgi:rhamnulokinase